MANTVLETLWERAVKGESLNQQEAITVLSDCDHGILRGNVARTITKPFGFTAHTYPIKDTRSEFKGAHLPWVEEGEVAKDVVDAMNLAMELCDNLKLKYRSDFFGRGSQFQECMRHLKEYTKA